MKLAKYESFVNESGTTYIARCGTVNIDGRKTYNSPALLADFFGDSIGIRNCAEEHVYIACLNQRMKMIGCFEISRGSVNTSMFPIREILQKSLLIGAVNIALSHNHPSGDITPSNADIESTKRLKQACDICGIGIVDHVIIGANNANYYSMFESGMIQGGDKMSEGKKMAMDDRQLLENIAADMGGNDPQSMSDTELIIFICMEV